MDFLHAIEHHILDHTLAAGWAMGPIQLAVTKHSLMLWITAGLMLLTMPLLAFRWPAIPSGPRAMLEIFVVFIRDEIVLPNTGKEGLKYLPYFLTLFFFILFMNLLGMVPGSASATGNISVTAALAIATFLLIHISGMVEHGIFHHFKNFIPHGLPWWLVPLMLPLELIGLLTKSFALSIRLFANMIAGHIVLLAFLSLSFLLAEVLPDSGMVAVGGVSVLVGAALSILETFVCFLQAYIFTFLTAIFVGSSLHPH